MKKFLSLVLALVMTMSLVTISAGATEYKDLKDKSEITYEEAVAVMNKIGIISGYEDGTFKPTATLTRGAAAKIITYMMLGTVAAEQLGVAGKPYKDVALDNTFAPYIAYCKSTGLINGYSDGTFRPGAPLDGYSFSKMLLTALGYSSEYEGFIGSGWQTNVASIAVKTGLYAGKDAFVGSATVTREEACLYAFNTLQATEVEYTGLDITVTNKDTNVQIGNSTASWVTNDKQASLDKTYNNVRDGLTQFCEEHFSALKLVNDGNAYDDFGRPANKWSFKKATIGTYALTADFSFTASTGDSDKDESFNAKDFGMKGYNFAGKGVTAVINGANAVSGTEKAADGYMVNSFIELSNLSGNGTTIELFTDADAANTITDIVIIRTQLMKVGSVNASAKTVALKKVEDDTKSFKAVELVKEDAAGYTELSAMKTDDLVIITPVANGSKWEVASVTIPTTATGKLSKVNRNASNTNTTGITVAGTDYKMSYNWSAADGKSNLDASSVNTKRDATVYVDAFGYAIYVKDIVAATSYILYDDTYAALVDGKIHYYANGYDMSGNALSLDFGTVGTGMTAGNVYAYKAETKNGAEYAKDTGNNRIKTTGLAITAGASYIPGTSYYFASGVKFIFTNLVGGIGGDLDGITVKDGVQEVKNLTNGVQYVLNKDDAVTAVIVGNDKDVEVSKNVLYVSKYLGSTTLDGKTVSRFDAYIDGAKEAGLTATKSLGGDMADKFYTYAKDANGNYVLNNYNTASGKATSVISGATFANTAANVVNKAYVKTLSYTENDVVKTVSNLKLAGAQVIDLTTNGTLQSFADMAENKAPAYTVSIVYNDGSTSAAKTVSYVFIKAYDGAVSPVVPSVGNVEYTGAVANNGTLRLNAEYTRPSYVPMGASVTIKSDVYANGTYVDQATFTIDANKTTARGTVITDLTAGDVITVDTVSEKPSEVIVKYVDKDGKELPKSTFVTTGDKTGFTKTVAASDLKFELNTTDTTTPVSYTVTGLETTTSGSATGKTSETVCTAEKALGTDYVVVKFTTDLATLKETYSVTFGDKGINADVGIKLNTLCGYKDATLGTTTLLLEAAPDTAIPSKGSTTITATLGAAIGADVNYGLKVVLTDGVNTYDLIFLNDGATDTADVVISGIKSNVALTVKSISNIAAPTITKVFVSADTDTSNTLTAGDVITVQFSEKVTGGDVAPVLSKNGTFDVGAGALAKDGMSATYAVTADHTDADSLSIDGGLIVSAATNVAAANVWTITTLAKDATCVVNTELKAEIANP